MQNKDTVLNFTQLHGPNIVGFSKISWGKIYNKTRKTSKFCPTLLNCVFYIYITKTLFDCTVINAIGWSLIESEGVQPKDSATWYSTHTCFNATEVQLQKWCFHTKLLIFKILVHMWRSLSNACRRSVRALSYVYCNHNNNGPERTVVETVEHTWIVNVAEPTQELPEHAL
jgi:hypothetical protein